MEHPLEILKVSLIYSLNDLTIILCFTTGHRLETIKEQDPIKSTVTYPKQGQFVPKVTWQE